MSSSSLNSLKQTLWPCTGLRSTAPSPETSSEIPSPPPPTRKPPKSSLSQQLQRLADRPFPPPKNPTAINDSECQIATTGRVSVLQQPCIPQQGSAFEARGPYEPLLLSLPSETPIVKIPASINCRLLEHQRVGVRFLYSLYKSNHGGVLGDDMGLGKTIQTIAFLAAVFGKDTENGVLEKAFALSCGPVLIVCPTSVIRNWENEFSEWCDFSVAVYHGPNRELVIEKIENQGAEIIITSFDTFRIHDKILCNIAWDIVIIDEAHRLKNEKSQLYKSITGIKTRKRYGLTGTVMQNRIVELFNLFDWVAPGCLGTWEHFRDFYDEPLKHGQRLSAPERFIQIADERKKHLVAVLRKYMLRRTKEETIGHLLLGKEDNVVFCSMSELQKRVYKRMLEQPDIQCLINKDLPCSCGSPLTQVECCKRIVPDGIIWSYLHRENPDGCESCPFCLVLPCLIKLQQISNHLELIKPNPKDDVEKQKKDAELVSAVFGADLDLVGGSAQTESFMGLSDVEHCGKMRALEKLLLSWTTRGDKILLFSYSVRMLDILEKFLVRKGYCFSRLDGSTPMNVRQALVDDFNRSPSKQVFLISTRAGGLGLNLVSANRVVIFDPNWNPAQDLQAQDRSFRYGQKRHVVVLRLLAAGSLEELVYSRQVYKQQLSNVAVSGKMEKRYFQGVQDCKELQGELFGICNLFRDLSDKLFTSEIIEMHKGENHSTAHSKTNIPILISPKKAPEISHLNEMCSRSSATENYRQLHDLGIVYAHRNEDVVNVGSGLALKHDAKVAYEDCCGETSGRPQDNNSSQRADSCDMGKVPSEEQKKKEFHRVALYMGMNDLDFSNWVLSASSSERTKMLEDYKKNRRKRKGKNIPPRLKITEIT